MKLLKYFFLLQVLCFGELFSWQNFPSANLLGSKEENSEEVRAPTPIYPGVDKIYQRIDHFDSKITYPWAQYYTVFDDYYKPGGPIFLAIDTHNFLRIPSMFEYAQRYGGMIFILEHRYYGRSRPTPDTSTRNLKYLTSQQALADAAYFITRMNRRYTFPEGTKWIAIGSGYSGTLAAWLRLKYPHLVHGAVASSAPLQAQYRGYLDFYNNTEKVLNDHSEGCGSAVNEAFAEMNELWKSESGQTQLKQQLHLCLLPFDSYSKMLDQANLNFNLANMIASTVTGQLKFTKNFKGLCEIMANETLGTPVQRIGTFVSKNVYLCLRYRYQQTLFSLYDSRWESEAVLFGDRQWLYQTLTEFGFTAVPDPSSSIKYDFHMIERLGLDVFGKELNSRYQTNVLYGGSDIAVTNVVFVQGSEDPWNKLGVQQNVSSSSPLIVVEGGFHATDDMSLYPPESVKAAKEQIYQNIESWLEE